MTVMTHDSERSQLERVDKAIEKWLELLIAESTNVDLEQVKRFVKTTKRYAIRLDEHLPPTLDPSAVAEIRGILLGGIRKLEQAEDSDGAIGPLDILDDFMVRAESIRHILRDVLDEDIGAHRHDTQALVGLLEAWLSGVPRSDLARLLDVSVRTLQRYAKEGGPASRRLWLVTRLVAVLHRAWTPQGVVAWFDRNRAELDERSPRDVLDEPEYEAALMLTARQGRAQHGA